jgi:hypothetical protein
VRRRVGRHAAKLEALQLAGLRARQLGDVLDGAGIFVRRDGRLDVVLQGLGRSPETFNEVFRLTPVLKYVREI